MARESALWETIKKARVVFGDALHLQRIENMLGAGTPDVEGYLDYALLGSAINRRTGQFWLELKSSARPVRPTTPVRFKLRGRDEQIEFMRRRWALGGNAFFLLQVGAAAKRMIYLAPGDIGTDLKRGLTEAELALACTGTGIFKGNQFGLQELFTRIVSCRASPYRSCHFPS